MSVHEQIAMFDTLREVIVPLYGGSPAARSGATDYQCQIVEGLEAQSPYSVLLVTEHDIYHAAQTQNNPVGEQPSIILSPELYVTAAQNPTNFSLDRSRLYLYRDSHGKFQAIGHTNGMSAESVFGQWAREHGPDVRVLEDSINSGETMRALIDFLQSMGVRVDSVAAGYNGGDYPYVAGTNIPITAPTYRKDSATLYASQTTQVARSIEPQDLGQFKQSGPALVGGAADLYAFYAQVRFRGAKIRPQELYSFARIYQIEITSERHLRKFLEKHPRGTFEEFLADCVSLSKGDQKVVAPVSFDPHRQDIYHRRRWLTWPYQRPDEGIFKAMTDRQHMELSRVSFDAMIVLLDHVYQSTGRMPTVTEFPGLSLPTVQKKFHGFVPTYAIIAFKTLSRELGEELGKRFGPPESSQAVDECGWPRFVA